MELLIPLSTLLAILAGPVAAVLVARHLNKKDGRDRRRHEAFALLLGSLGERDSLSHRTATIQIRIEFEGEKEVVRLQKIYYKKLVAGHGENGDDILSELIRAIAKVLGSTIEKSEISPVPK